ncbi:MAG: hypothetical protein DRJ40_00300 [Thermoprotei archaeon]|nr:MAG: hypothetical protein DRJ40_00300 [Thermoprotei archaeon]
MEHELIINVVQVLRKTSDEVSAISSSHRKYSFNVVAKNVKGKNLVLSVTADVDRVSKRAVKDLVVLSYTTKSVPLIVSNKCKGKELAEGVVYKRFGIYTINFETFKDMLEEEKYPQFYSEKGGIYVRIKGRVLRQLREKYNLSLGEVARSIGLTRKAIYEYERDSMDASAAVAQKLIELFGEEIIEEINPMEWNISKEELHRLIDENREISKLSKSVREVFPEDDYELYELYRCPFDAVAHSKHENIFLKVIYSREGRRIQRGDISEVTVIGEVARVLDAKLAFLVPDRNTYELVRDAIPSDVECEILTSSEKR